MTRASKAVIAAAFIAVTSIRAQTPSRVQSSREVPVPAPAKADADFAGLFRFEPTGLSLLRPYSRGRIPVVLIHGLWSNPWSWARMIEDLEADAALRNRYQLWTYGYSTGDPLPYTAGLLRRDLDEVRRRFDPDCSDAAWDRMVLVGHSMGGLLTKMMVQDSRTRLWRLISDRPPEDLAGEPDHQFKLGALRLRGDRVGDRHRGEAALRGQRQLRDRLVAGGLLDPREHVGVVLELR